MIEIWIRHQDESVGRRLCTWPDVKRLDDIIPTISRWGVTFEERTYYQRDMSGEIRIQDGDAYFEVLLSDDWEES